MMALDVNKTNYILTTLYKCLLPFDNECDRLDIYQLTRKLLGIDFTLLNRYIDYIEKNIFTLYINNNKVYKCLLINNDIVHSHEIDDDDIHYIIVKMYENKIINLNDMILFIKAYEKHASNHICFLSYYIESINYNNIKINNNYKDNLSISY